MAYYKDTFHYCLLGLIPINSWTALINKCNKVDLQKSVIRQQLFFLFSWAAYFTAFLLKCFKVVKVTLFLLIFCLLCLTDASVVQSKENTVNTLFLLLYTQAACTLINLCAAGKHLWPKPLLPVVRHTQAHLNVNTAACRKCKLYVHAALQWPAKSASQTVRS